MKTHKIIKTAGTVICIIAAVLLFTLWALIGRGMREPKNYVHLGERFNKAQLNGSHVYDVAVG